MISLGQSSIGELGKFGFGLGTCKVLPNFRVSKRLYNNQKAKSRVVSNSDEKTQFQLDCETLGVGETCDHSQARAAFIKLAKLYHPDGQTETANAEKFHKCDMAYRNLLKKFADERHNSNKVEGEYGLYYEEKRREREKAEKALEESPDIEHTAPQHRQYLNNEGIGMGSPFQREKQYQKFRAARASSNLYDHRIQKLMKETELGAEEKALAVDKKAARKNKTTFAMDRLVEDLIQESMQRGEFENLEGKGKPLKHDSSYNPYIDFTTHKLNKVLIDNGFTPEWILLEKEIRQEMRQLRGNLLQERHKYDENFQNSHETNTEWQKYLKSYLKPRVEELNHKIIRYNLVVPTLDRQIICMDLEREVTKVLSNFSQEMRKSYLEQAQRESLVKQRQTSEQSASEHNSNTLFGFLLSVIKGA